ncbi:MAG: UDP-N-acetylmuramoyl-L-alanine--D-glutamate ligase [candidate division WOR-3 bacterium]
MKRQFSCLNQKVGSAPTREWLKKARILILGLGRAGMSCAKFLLSIGAEVRGYDESGEVQNSKAVRELVRQGLILTERPLAVKPDMVVVSPGIGEDNRLVHALREEGVVLVDELDLASQLLAGAVIGVTGTNGKSTTTALIAKMLETSGKRVFCGGNLAPGRPLSDALMMQPKDYYVVEVSSFQLERARWFAPRGAVILNITADHLNRHRSIKEYAECKLRILDRQQKEDFAVLNALDPRLFAARRRGLAQKVFFTTKGPVCPGAYLARDEFWWSPEPGVRERVARRDILQLRGRHNIENCLAAICAARLFGVTPPAIRKALRGFRGLEHRLELVRVLNGVEYINNSMCTNPASGIRSLEAFDRPVILIAGGREKNLPIRDYVRAMVRRAKWVLLLGENRQRLAGLLAAAGYHRFELCSGMRDAVERAKDRARPGDVVLFSPGFASFDQFRDFQERGRAFKDAVRKLS